MPPPRKTKQIHIPIADWKTIEARAPKRGRSTTVAALARALEAGDVANFDKHLAAVQAETKEGQAKRMRALRATRATSASPTPTASPPTPAQRATITPVATAGTSGSFSVGMTTRAF